LTVESHTLHETLEAQAKQYGTAVPQVTHELLLTKNPELQLRTVNNGYIKFVKFKANMFIYAVDA
jgi:hypothetical protein